MFFVQTAISFQRLAVGIGDATRLAQFCRECRYRWCWEMTLRLLWNPVKAGGWGADRHWTGILTLYIEGCWVPLLLTGKCDLRLTVPLVTTTTTKPAIMSRSLAIIYEITGGDIVSALPAAWIM